MMPGSGKAEDRRWPQDVGIIAMEVYFPSQYVDQSELEDFDAVSKGKYTIGLGQDKMGFCSDREDINSLCLTVVHGLLEKNRISYNDIGRLEVGTETILDKSKSVKTVLMQLFEESGNTDIDGIDTTNACYGGTAALFNAVNWVESSSWDGRYAIVVAGDIAVYATGNARCTGGAGAIAMLIGPNAPLILDRGCRAIHMEHAYDFYKPNMSSEYPVVDGSLTIQCYLRALDKCCNRYAAKATAAGFKAGPNILDCADAFLFHSPFCKLVMKSVGRLMLNDFHNDPHPDYKDKYSGLEPYRDIPLEETYLNKEVERAFMSASEEIYRKKTKPSLLLANQVGNMYTPSVFGGLVSYLISHPIEELVGKRCVLFSYGSGLASCMYSLHITEDVSPHSQLYPLLHSLSDVQLRLEKRQKVPPAGFDEIMKLREMTHHKAPYSPVGSTDHLFPGTWYLTDIDDKHRRRYERKPPKMVQLTHSESLSVRNEVLRKSVEEHTPLNCTDGEVKVS